MKTKTAKELLVSSLSSQYLVTPYDDEMIIITPFAFENGTVIDVRASFHDDQVTINDDGRVAQELDALGVDVLGVGSNNVTRSWRSIQQSLPFAPAIGSQPWEIAVTADAQFLGMAVNAVAEAAVRAEALKVFAVTHAPRSFSETIIKYLSEHKSALTVVPQADIPLAKGGTRKVSFSATYHQKLFVQSASLADGRNAAFDKVLGVFSPSSIAQSRRVVALDGQIGDWEPWHLEGMREVATVEEAYNVERFADHLLSMAA